LLSLASKFENELLGLGVAALGSLNGGEMDLHLAARRVVDWAAHPHLQQDLLLREDRLTHTARRPQAGFDPTRASL
jgi:hypothetical protein